MIRVLVSVTTFLIVGTCAQAIYAQEKSPVRTTGISTVLSAGLLTGESGGYLASDIVVSFRNKNWEAGIGSGIDAYRFFSFPLFISGEYGFTKRKLGIAYGKLGYHFPSVKKKQDAWAMSEDWRGGLYSEGGIGWHLFKKRKAGFIFSAGYSYKELSLKSEYVTTCLIPPCPVDVVEKKYALGRIVTRMSWAMNW